MNDDRKLRVMFHCQPTLGIGHFIRSREIVRALDGFDVTFVIGGEIPSGFELPAQVEVAHLPALQFDEEFRTLSTAEGETDLEVIKNIRKAELLAAFDYVKPDLLVIELFPFGRRKFDFELVPLLERAKQSGTKVICSLRDILVGKRKQAQFDEAAVRLMNEHFDLLLIHSDPNFQKLEETFTRLHDLTCDIRYTGFVLQRIEEDFHSLLSFFKPDVPVIIVSVGGGRVGHELIECTIEAQPRIAERFAHQMLILCGPQMPIEMEQRIKQLAETNSQITVERYVANLPLHLKYAALSISMGGYNTCMDLLASGVRAIVYPFTGNDNQEQTMRAAKLAAMGRLRLIHAGELTPERLTEEALLALQMPDEALHTSIDTNGAAKTAEILIEIGLNKSWKEREVTEHG
ncbi:MAG TPA: glycosyltransferase [Blastocatellia bacterium]|nr:glycosyltransferase [Blastocatellia bacterium]